MSSEKLGHNNNVLKGDLGGGFNILTGSTGEQTDLGIARRFGGSAAAYSLRDIGAMNGKVVNVRRDMDDPDGDTSDPEESFSASQVASGALEDWVNGKLENTLPADVATAAAAYSLRKVKASYSGNAVRIRRSSDDIEVDVAFDSDGKVSASSAITNVAEEGGESGSTTATTLGDFISGTDAFVHTWYDQAGSNDAVQATAISQPKIAENGALLTDANGKPELSFTPTSTVAGEGKFLEFTKINFGGTMSFFSKLFIRTPSGGTGGRHFSEDGSASSSTSLIIIKPTQYNFFSGASNLINTTGTHNVEMIQTFLLKDQNKLNIFQNAVADSNNEVTLSNTISDYELGRIGNAPPSGNANEVDMDVSELILYSTDQTDNRFKIESNINNYYGLYNDANETSATEFSFRNERTGGVTVSNGLSGFTLDVETASAFAGFQLKQKVANTDVIYLSFNAVLTGGSGGDASPKVALRETGITNTVRSNEFDIKAGFNSVELISNNDNAEYLAFSEGDDNKIFTISDLKVSRIARNGFVETWYDQSSNGNDATQATASKQPKIVSNGGTNKLEGLPTINFDDATSHCLTSSSYSRSGSDLPLSMMAVFDKSTTDTDYLFAANKSNDDAFQRLVLRSSSFEYGERDDSNTQKIGTGGSPSLNTIFLMSAFTGGTTSSAFVNGSSIISDQDTDLGTQTFDQIDIGANNGDGASSANPFSGNISELYLFETNLSTDRTNIESEIANHYNITLS